MISQIKKRIQNYFLPLIVFLACQHGPCVFGSVNKDKLKELGFPIIQFFGDKTAGDFALLGAQKNDGVGQGMLLVSYRPLDSLNLWVETGKLKVVGNRNGYAFAQIFSKGSDLSDKVFPKFSAPMAGDIVVPHSIEIKRKSIVLPTLEMNFFDLFVDPSSSPTTFELSPLGRKVLNEKTTSFSKARVSLILVEGHTSFNGPSEANQIESFERAKTVRSFLIDRLGMSPERLIAIGHGETALKDKSATPGHNKRNRRIVIKAIQTPEPMK